MMLVMAVLVFATTGVAFAENIDPNEDGRQYAYGENVGWINFNSVDLFGNGVLARKVNLIDLGNFVF
jgi:hypothetical protein